MYASQIHISIPIRFTIVASIASAASACTFDPSGILIEDIDAAPVSVTEDIAHVPMDVAFFGTQSLTWTGNVNINTSALEINSQPVGPGIAFTTTAQEPPGPELALLHVESLRIEQNVQVRVYGDRPLVILASGPVSVAGTMDATAKLDFPGPGGARPGTGDGRGAAGSDDGGIQEGGGGGGGFGAAGAEGGDGCDAIVCRGTGGMPYGADDLAVLLGGSGGGTGGAAGNMPCGPAPGGGGGGAVQIYSAMSITVSGIINAGGGGGRGGWPPRNCNSASAAGGGGSGGAIYLQSPEIHLVASAEVVANGGGGGAGASGNNAHGADGMDGQPSTFPAAGGQARRNGFGSDGGNGGSLVAPAQAGVTEATRPNGGGGGGGVGRIVLSSHEGGTSLVGSVSPEPVLVSY